MTECCSLGISIFKNTCQMQLFRDPLPQIIFYFTQVLSYLSFSWLPLINQQLVSRNKTLPRNKQDQSLLLNLFEVLTAKNLTVVGLSTKVNWKKRCCVIILCQKCPPSLSIEGMNLLPVSWVSYLTSNIHFTNSTKSTPSKFHIICPGIHPPGPLGQPNLYDSYEQDKEFWLNL